MFDEYYVVHIVVRVRTSVTTTNTCISLSFARPPSLLLLLQAMVMLCFEVMNTVHTCLTRILVYVIYIESPVYILNEDTQPVIRAIGVSHTACKDEFRQNIRSHSWSVF